jgi:hypothetical protein
MKRWPFEWDGISRGNNLVVFYYLGSSEIWPDKRGDFEEDYCTTIKKVLFHLNLSKKPSYLSLK